MKENNSGFLIFQEKSYICQNIMVSVWHLINEDRKS